MLALFFLELNSKGFYPCSSAEKEKGIDVLCSGPPQNVLSESEIAIAIRIA